MRITQLLRSIIRVSPLKNQDYQVKYHGEEENSRFKRHLVFSDKLAHHPAANLLHQNWAVLAELTH